MARIEFASNYLESAMKLEATEIVDAKVFYFHFRSEDGEHSVFSAVLEPSYGVLAIISNTGQWSSAWPHKEKWGTETFEEFLCNQRPAQLTSALMGASFYEIDFEATAGCLVGLAPDLDEEIADFIGDLHALGIVAAELESVSIDLLRSAVTGPLCDSIQFKTTEQATMMVAEVMPCLQNQIRPKNLSIC